MHHALMAGEAIATAAPRPATDLAARLDQARLRAGAGPARDTPRAARQPLPHA